VSDATHLRPFRAGDEPALAHVCLRTADDGADATGALGDDAIWGEIFVLPYAARHPELAFVIETGDGRVAGYVVAAPETREFVEWFRTEWWPDRGARFPRPGSNPREREILAYADGRAGDREVYAAEYPAHLHIDLLPELQGQGWGRRLIAEVTAALRARGVPGLHLVAAADNAGALAFYDRLGFERLPSEPGSQAFGMRLA
jgi:ribosomal protein S18 acetylase RimI-like enzyme